MRNPLPLEEIVELIASGQPETAERECEFLVACSPELASAWSLLGALRLQNDKLTSAKQALQQAIALQPLLAKAHHNLGSVFAAEKNIPAALACYRQALSIEPELLPTHYALGRLLKDELRFKEAIPHLQIAQDSLRNTDALIQLADALNHSGATKEAVELIEKHYPNFHDDPVYLNFRGNLHLEIGQLNAATESYHQAIRIAPENPLAYNNLGVALLKQTRFDEAAGYFRKAVALAPDNADFLFSLGNALTELGRTAESIPLLENGNRRWENNVNGLTNLGLAYVTARQAERALIPLKQALALAPSDPEAHNNLGAAYEALDQHELACQCYYQALQLKPDYPQPFNNLGNIALAKLELEEAATFYLKAIHLDEHLADAHMNLGLVHLLRGEYEAGWPEYEWRRYATSEKNKYQTFEQPEWTDQAISGKRLLLYAEQGLGDTIQFIRYAVPIKKMGATVIVQCQPALTRLLKTAAGIDLLVDTNQPLPSFDIYTPLLSLPKLLGSTAETIPNTCPYLYPDTAAQKLWARRLEQSKKIKVGFAWAGNPSHRNDKNRSCPLKHFLPLTNIPNTQFFSLQKGIANSSLAELSPSERVNVIDLTRELDDFADSAALLANLDLLITVDTSLAHLAGAIGIPTWLVLPFSPDWRWLLERTDSPWYPSIKLYRQTSAGNWDSVFSNVKNDLTLCASNTHEKTIT